MSNPMEAAANKLAQVKSDLEMFHQKNARKAAVGAGNASAAAGTAASAVASIASAGASAVSIGANAAAKAVTTQQSFTQPIIPPKITEKMAKAIYKIQGSIRQFLYQKARKLRNLKWMTGSNGHYALPGLTHTNDTLIPTGKLITQRIAPLGGELGNGVSPDGVNQLGLSGVGPEFSATAWKYANMEHTPIQELESSIVRRLEEALTMFEGTKGKAYGLACLSDINRLVLTLRQINEKLYQEKFSKQVSELLKLINDDSFWFVLNEAKRTQHALKLAPLATIELDKETNWEEITKLLTKNGYKPFWAEIDFEINGVKNTLSTKLCPDTFSCESRIDENFFNGTLADKIMVQKMIDAKSMAEYGSIILKFTEGWLLHLERERRTFREIHAKGVAFTYSKQALELMRQQNKFPIIFATSKNIPSEKTKYRGEIVYCGNLKLGREIDVILTDAENLNRLRKHLRTRQLPSKVFTCSYEAYIKLQENRIEAYEEKILGKLNNILRNIKTPAAHFSVEPESLRQLGKDILLLGLKDNQKIEAKITEAALTLWQENIRLLLLQRARLLDAWNSAGNYPKYDLLETLARNVQQAYLQQKTAEEIDILINESAEILLREHPDFELDPMSEPLPEPEPQLEPEPEPDPVAGNPNYANERRIVNRSLDDIEVYFKPRVNKFFD